MADAGVSANVLSARPDPAGLTPEIQGALAAPVDLETRYTLLATFKTRS